MLTNVTLKHSVLEIDINDFNLDTSYQDQKVMSH